MKSDIQIAQETKLQLILDVAKNYGIDPDALELYGNYKAKIDMKKIDTSKKGKLVLVTAINPTPAGEGKTTTTIGLSQGLNLIGKKSIVALREPSLGPCMGIKGGATGGGYAQVVPMEDINLHFTGDFHAITTANNLLSAMIDNHIYQGNEMEIHKVVWKRVLDMNDRELRTVIIGTGGDTNGIVREDNFMISVASEIMAIVCLAEDIFDLKEKLGNIIIGYKKEGTPVYAKDIEANGAMTVVLKDAIKPNLVQTLEGTPAIIHGGPFANIAHGCNSILATKVAMSLSDITITEAGFGADLGAEKFFDIKCRKANLKPDAVVLVATVRALKYNGGQNVKELKNEDLQALKEGFANLQGHIENVQKFGVPLVVTLNVFETDTEAEINYVKENVLKMGAEFELSLVHRDGGKGGINLAKKVVEVLETKESKFDFLYDLDLSIEDKVKTVATKIYGADDVKYSLKAKKILKQIEDLGLTKLPICVAKTQISFSDNKTLLGRPKGFTVTVTDMNISNGAGFIVVLLGGVMTMPGLPKVPAANGMDIDKDGNIVGLS